MFLTIFLGGIFPRDTVGSTELDMDYGGADNVLQEYDQDQRAEDIDEDDEDDWVKSDDSDFGPLIQTPATLAKVLANEVSDYILSLLQRNDSILS